MCIFTTLRNTICFMSKINEKIVALRKRRLELGLTQREVAKEIGIKYQYLGKLEREGLSVGLDILEKWADALDCELRLLLK